MSAPPIPPLGHPDRDPNQKAPRTPQVVLPDPPDAYRLEHEIASFVDEQIADVLTLSPLRIAGTKFEFEECDEPFDPWVLVRESDGQRFELEVAVYVRELPPKPPEPDPDAPVHCEGQEALDLGGAS